MLKEALCLVFFGSLLMVTVSAESCSTDADCRDDECCIEFIPYYRRCADKPDDPGDRCKGQFKCDCKAGLVCELDPPSVYNYVKVGIGACKNK